jgi:ribosomal-protein-alanine N-acetyltransferase
MLCHCSIPTCKTCTRPLCRSDSSRPGRIPSPRTSRALVATPGNLVFIAEVDSEPAGYAYAEIVQLSETPMRHAWKEVHLHHISVRPAYRRNGVASALLDAVRAAGGENGIGLVTLQVWTFNEGAQAFFRRQGFTPYMARLWSRQAP